MVEGADGTLWIGAVGGLFQFDGACPPRTAIVARPYVNQ